MATDSSGRHGPTLDRTAQALSLLCTVHCLATPLVLGALPALRPGFLEGPSVHAALALVLLALGAAALVPGYRRHRRRRVLALAVAGYAVLLSALLPCVGEGLERALTLCASALLIAAHAQNRGACAQCRLTR
jgi:hypothetical protein